MKLHHPPAQSASMISKDLTENAQTVEGIFKQCDDLIMLSWNYGHSLKERAMSVYFETLTYSNKELNYMREALQDLLVNEMLTGREKPEALVAFLEKKGIPSRKFTLLKQMGRAIDQILAGNYVVFIHGWSVAISFDSFSIETRYVSEPMTESVVHGPHEGTVESLKKNIGLLRYRMKDSGFKLISMITGGTTRTEIAYGYLEHRVNPEVLAEFRKRIAKASSMDILDTTYVEELIEDSTYSPFPQHRITERPDSAVAALLEGKIIVVVQGSPSILICPGLFVEFFQSSEDYYERTLLASLIRLLRLLAFGIALTLPGIYISLSTFQPELIPTVLLLAVINSREGIPFPSFVEAVIMQFFFELLREAGIRLPKPVGSAVSIVGALVIGEAAISAGIASPIMVVIIALTGIASFAIPQYSIAITLRILQFPLMLLAAMLGVFGMMIGLLWMILHITSLRSLGQPYFTPFAPMRPNRLKDVLVRVPLTRLNRSPNRKNT